MTDVETVLEFFEDHYEFDEAAFRDATIENFSRLDEEADDAAAIDASDGEADGRVSVEADD